MQMGVGPITIFWFRRDLRLKDNHGLFRALADPYPVLPIFIFDSLILEQLGDRRDKRVAFIYQSVLAISGQLERLGSAIYVGLGEPLSVFDWLIRQYGVAQVFTNRDVEPYALERDAKVEQMLSAHGIRFATFNDQVIFDSAEIVKPDGTPYVKFTPYSKTWKQNLGNSRPQTYGSEGLLARLMPHDPLPVPALSAIGFEAVDPGVPPMQLQPDILKGYAATRNLPYLAGTSHVSTHLRFGTVSIRHLVDLALKYSDNWLDELIWREFFMMILYQFPHVVRQSFHRKYDHIRWRNNEKEFAAWCNGTTGFPLVDAGMRELNRTGLMHNRVRMVVASFLTKDLLIDWRWGEAYFAERLLDYELSSNNGNWQWAAGTGCDAAPYFRVFNPLEQARKFDPDGIYIRKWIPEYHQGYAPQIVDHVFARDRALMAYRRALEA